MATRCQQSETHNAGQTFVSAIPPCNSLQSRLPSGTKQTGMSAPRSRSRPPAASPTKSAPLASVFRLRGLVLQFPQIQVGRGWECVGKGSVSQLTVKEDTHDPIRFNSDVAGSNSERNSPDGRAKHKCRRARSPSDDSSEVTIADRPGIHPSMLAPGIGPSRPKGHGALC